MFVTASTLSCIDLSTPINRVCALHLDAADLVNRGELAVEVWLRLQL